MLFRSLREGRACESGQHYEKNKGLPVVSDHAELLHASCSGTASWDFIGAAVGKRGIVAALKDQIHPDSANHSRQRHYSEYLDEAFTNR